MKKAPFLKNIFFINSYENDPIKDNSYENDPIKNNTSTKTIYHELKNKFVLINNFR